MRVLSVVHNHSSIHPGGTEMVAEGLHQSYRTTPGVDARLLAAVDPELRPGVPGTTVRSMASDPTVFFFRASGFDVVDQSRYSLEPLLYDVAWFLQDFRPNVVHIHHFNYFGIELLKLIRNECRSAKIVITLHDYYLLCGNDGILFNSDGVRCNGPEPEACFRCFPDRSPATFAARRQHLLNHLKLADRLVAPSTFLRDRFVEWGVPGAQIEVIRNGWTAEVPEGAAEMPDTRNFALLGNLRRTKGTLVAAKAFAAAAKEMEQPPVLDIYGSALYQPEDFQEELDSVIEAAGGTIRLHGRYQPEDLAPALSRAAWVLVPSIWWENAPLVINEAFSFGRPVLCSDIGGMAEAVRDKVDGLHVRAGDIGAWSEAIASAAGNEVLWRKLNGGIGDVRTVPEAAADYLALFERRKAA